MDIKKISLNNTSYNIRDSRVTTNVVNGNAVWTSANSIAVTNAANGNVIKESGVSITTSLGSDNTTVPTSLAVKNAIDALPAPMVFKGSLGTGGTITTLPTASASNTGYTYKVITAGTYASQAAKVGDTFISDGSSWVLIPSGDEPSGTVTSVATGNGLTGGPITSSGTISLDTQYVKNQTYEDFKAGGGLLVQYNSDNYGNVQDVTYSLSTATASLLGGIKVGSGLSVTNDGTLSANISGKADKVSGATNGNLAALDSNGNLIDSGKSISTTAVSTATHFLATDSSISSIAPITTANLASVLGGLAMDRTTTTNLHTSLDTNKIYSFDEEASGASEVTGKPWTGNSTGCMINLQGSSTNEIEQIVWVSNQTAYFRRLNKAYPQNIPTTPWSLLTLPTYLKPYSDLSSLASALEDLGAIKTIYKTSSPLADFDSVDTPGRYLFANDAAFNNAANVPMSGLQSPAYLDVVRTSGAQYQILHCLKRNGNDYNELVFERKINTPITPWSRLDNFGCNTLDELSTALNVPADQDIDAYAADFSLYNNEIIYYSSEKLTETTSTKTSGLHTNLFFAESGSYVQMTLHTWANGVGRIVFAEDIVTIGDYAFFLSMVYKVKLPRSIKYLGLYAFGMCSLLESVNISNVLTIGEYAFVNCTKLLINILKCNIVGSSAFGNCSSINSILFINSGANLTIGRSAFLQCMNLQSVSASSDYYVSIGEYAFAYCYSLTSVNFATVSVLNYAFLDCRSLVYFNTSYSTELIGNYAFLGCHSLTTIYMGNANSVTTLGTNAFDKTYNLSKIIVPSSLVSQFKSATNWLNYSAIIVSA